MRVSLAVMAQLAEPAIWERPAVVAWLAEMTLDSEAPEVPLVSRVLAAETG